MSKFTLPHINISKRIVKQKYQAPRRNMGGGSAPRVRAEHGARILKEMKAAFIDADDHKLTHPDLEPSDAVYLEVELLKGANPDAILEQKKQHVRTGASQKTEDDRTRVALLVPDNAREVVESILEDYTSGPLTDAGNPQRQNKVEPIEAVRRARLETFWTDELFLLPKNDNDEIWWEVWCFKGMEEKVADVAKKLNSLVSDTHYWLHFPEAVVLQIHCQKPAIELLLFATSGISELRKASASPAFYINEDVDEQLQWTEELADRVSWPHSDAPAVCLLDTGVNRAHMLLEPALSDTNLYAVNSEWGKSDSTGHGTGMAGLALYGDLTPSLEDNREISLTHRIESVKILPPVGFEANDPASYGSITQTATSLAEIGDAERNRVFCLSVTNEFVSGARASTWSAAIDQAAVGGMLGDEDDAPNRLYVISAGNIPSEVDVTKLVSNEDAPIEDPAQAWNALTVGGYTNKTVINDEGYESWSPLAEAGTVSPYSRTSVTWPKGKSPFKPDVVFEAGNRAISPRATEALDLDSLSLVTTGENTSSHPLIPFAATSAAAAQGARLAAMLQAEQPHLWPETIRALIVHSAEWTNKMVSELNSTDSMSFRYNLLRKFGHGVPDFGRAVASAKNHLAIIAQNEISPFRVEGGQKKFGDCHFYKLPWPKEILESLGEQNVRLKVTLSYFIEPNPGRFASIDAQRYQSFGLRFDLKRRLESEREFVERVNALERNNPLGSGPDGIGDSGWKFGSKSISAGSLHCDEWIGPAVQLAARNIIGVKPVTGWWRDSVKNARRQSRYSLVLTLSTPDVDIDLHTPIQNIVENELGIKIQTTV